jgi:GR25 family glycosyltransferase involved in LPS biosynthesis
MDRAKTRKRKIFNVPTYVINMKERADRWKRFTQQPVIHKLKHLKQFTAVNGKKLDYMKDRRISVRTRLNIFRNYRRSHHEIATLGAVGASLSHVGVWKKFLASGAKHCLIFEDDAILTESIFDDISRLFPKLPADWGVWVLGYYKANLVYEPYHVKPWNHVYKFTAAHAYLITREAAKKLLADALPIESHVDHYIGDVGMVSKMLVLEHPDINIEYFQKEKVLNSATTTVDSNTSQHKKDGCRVCRVPDDMSQIYKGPLKTMRNGLRVHGLVEDEQDKDILTLKRGATRKK